MTHLLRTRIRDAIAIGALRAGERLPSTRALARDVDADPRVVVAALRRLADEGLVEVRPRSGVYIAREQGSRSDRSTALPTAWVTDVVVEGVEHGVPVDRLSEWLATLVETHKVRAIATAPSVDQTVGIVRELRNYYGIAATPVFAEQLLAASPPSPLKRAHVLVTTKLLEKPVREIARQLSKPVIVVAVRPDLFSEEWLAFMQRRVYVVAVDPRFREILRTFLADVPGGRNVAILLAGKDDLGVVPSDAPTYVTESARRLLGRWRLPGRVVPPRRLFAHETVRDLVRFLVEHNERRSRLAASE